MSATLLEQRMNRIKSRILDQKLMVAGLRADISSLGLNLGLEGEKLLSKVEQDLEDSAIRMRDLTEILLNAYIKRSKSK